MDDWQTVVTDHGQTVWRTAYRLLGRHADAADCCQETFLAAIEICRRQKVRNWSALLTRLATCRALDQLRRRIRQDKRHADQADCAGIPSDNPGPVAQAEATELSERLREAMGLLTNGQAEVFCLRCLNDLSYRQIAQELGIHKSAVGVLLHRARARLRELLTSADEAGVTQGQEVQE